MATPDEQAQSMIANLPEKTGKPLDEWLALVAWSGAAKHGEIVKWLKGEHGMGHGFANLVAHMHLQSGAFNAGADEDLVAPQYAGPKAALKPIYDAVIAYATSLGDDVELAPKKANVSLRRSKQFGLAQPTTRTRFDLFVQLKGEEPRGRLLPGNAMCSHRIALESVNDFDDEAKAWLKAAYERA